VKLQHEVHVEAHQLWKSEARWRWNIVVGFPSHQFIMLPHEINQNGSWKSHLPWAQQIKRC
jgi:hypothetical protein